VSTTADALRDYQRWAERLAEARLGAHKARHHLERCHEAEHEAMRGIRDAVERMGGHDPLGISRSAQAKAAPVRDQVLAASGLLSQKLHGPPARPFQPAFDLRAAFGGALDWKTSEGEDKYRRGLYTEWRRSSPYPSMVTFDAPNREVCTLRRNRTNTPLQALVTMNDPVYVEAAQALARLIGHGPAPVEDKVRDGLRRVLLRPPAEADVAPLAALYRASLVTYSREPELAAAMIANPANPPPSTFAPSELAAWTAVANVLLNLDEFLMKP